MDVDLHTGAGNYFFFGPLLAIGGLGAALLLLLPPFLDISNSSLCGVIPRFSVGWAVRVRVAVFCRPTPAGSSCRTWAGPKIDFLGSGRAARRPC
jgi:hypothetical protein